MILRAPCFDFGRSYIPFKRVNFRGQGTAGNAQRAKEIFVRTKCFPSLGRESRRRWRVLRRVGGTQISWHFCKCCFFDLFYPLFFQEHWLDSAMPMLYVPVLVEYRSPARCHLKAEPTVSLENFHLRIHMDVEAVDGLLLPPAWRSKKPNNRKVRVRLVFLAIQPFIEPRRPYLVPRSATAQVRLTGGVRRTAGGLNRQQGCGRGAHNNSCLSTTS